MILNQGFSFTEVLITLLLISSASLALLHQQWQFNQLLHQSMLRATALNKLDNDTERILTAKSPTETEKPFHLEKTVSHSGIFLELSWACASIQRTVVCES